MDADFGNLPVPVETSPPLPTDQEHHRIDKSDISLIADRIRSRENSVREGAVAYLRPAVN